MRRFVRFPSIAAGTFLPDALWRFGVRCRCCLHRGLGSSVPLICCFALTFLPQVVRLAPNLPDPYHTLGLLHEAVGDLKKVR